MQLPIEPVAGIVLFGVPVALLQADDLETGLSQALGDDRARRAGADDQDVSGFDSQVRASSDSAVCARPSGASRAWSFRAKVNVCCRRGKRDNPPNFSLTLAHLMSSAQPAGFGATTTDGGGAIGVGLLGAVYIAEAVYLYLILQPEAKPAAILFGLVGLAVPIALGRTGKERLRMYAAVVPGLVLSVAGYVFLLALADIAAGL